jgi:hypothetical protein
MNYKDKYLKYKSKYLKLKNQKGGVIVNNGDRIYQAIKYIDIRDLIRDSKSIKIKYRIFMHYMNLLILNNVIVTYCDTTNEDIRRVLDIISNRLIGRNILLYTNIDKLRDNLRIFEVPYSNKSLKERCLEALFDQTTLDVLINLRKLLFSDVDLPMKPWYLDYSMLSSYMNNSYIVPESRIHRNFFESIHRKLKKICSIEEISIDSLSTYPISPMIGDQKLLIDTDIWKSTPTNEYLNFNSLYIEMINDFTIFAIDNIAERFSTELYRLYELKKSKKLAIQISYFGVPSKPYLQKLKIEPTNDNDIIDSDYSSGLKETFENINKFIDFLKDFSKENENIFFTNYLYEMKTLGLQHRICEIMSININTLMGPLLFKPQVIPTMTVLDLKKIIVSNEKEFIGIIHVDKFKVDDITLIYLRSHVENKIMDNDKTLSHYGIYNGATIDFSLKIKSGISLEDEIDIDTI